MSHFFIALFLFACTLLAASPAQVVLVRHGEKPPTGKKLSFKGYERAYALVPFFLKNPELLKHGPPHRIFAQSVPDHHAAKRSVETMKPLAKALNRVVHTPYVRKEAALLAAELKKTPKYKGKMVVACFEHKALAAIAQGLGAPVSEWPSDAYDLVWIIDLDHKGNFKHFHCMAQQLLDGDASKCHH